MPFTKVANNNDLTNNTTSFVWHKRDIDNDPKKAAIMIL